MLTHPVLDQLRSLRLEGMAKAFEEQFEMAGVQSLTFEDRLGFLVDREATERHNRRLATRLKKAKLRQKNACLEDFDFRNRRGLDKRLLMSLGSGEWIAKKRNVLITGPTGVGKTYLACALQTTSPEQLRKNEVV